MGVLDEFRDIPEGRDWRHPVPAGGSSLSAVVAAGGRATTRPSGRTRAFFWTMLPVAAVVAVLHPLLAGALAAGSNGSDPMWLAVDVLRAPHPAAQPAVLAAAAALLLVLSVTTRGFTRVTTVTSGLAVTACVAAIVAAVPFVLVLAVIALLVVLVALVGAALVGALISAAANS